MKKQFNHHNYIGSINFGSITQHWKRMNNGVCSDQAQCLLWSWLQGTPLRFLTQGMRQSLRMCISCWLPVEPRCQGSELRSSYLQRKHCPNWAISLDPDGHLWSCYINGHFLGSNWKWLAGASIMTPLYRYGNKGRRGQTPGKWQKDTLTGNAQPLGPNFQLPHCSLCVFIWSHLQGSIGWGAKKGKVTWKNTHPPLFLCVHMAVKTLKDEILTSRRRRNWMSRVGRDTHSACMWAFEHVCVCVWACEHMCVCRFMYICVHKYRHAVLELWPLNSVILLSINKIILW